MVHETKESSLQKSVADSYLAQLDRHLTDDQEVMGSNPSFDEISFVLLDDLTEKRQIPLSRKSRSFSSSLSWLLL